MARTPARQAEGLILAVTALLLPTLSLIPLGGWLLWEKGWLLYWAVASAFLICTIYALQKFLLRDAPALPNMSEPAIAASEAATERARAWQAVEQLARAADLSQITSREELVALGVKTIEAVASVMHPTRSSAVWQFTLPEALTITEQVSGRLNKYVQQTIPFSDRLTIAQMLSVYRARGVLTVANWAYDAWRVVRMINPATAVTNEARERLTRAIYHWGRDQVFRKLLTRYVEEVGRAAIDLYGGQSPVSSSAPPHPVHEKK